MSEKLVVNLHVAFSRAIILYLFFCAVWGIWNGLKNRPATPSYRTTLLIAEMLLVLEAIIGFELLGEGKQPAQPLHFLYGIFIVFVIPTTIGYVGRGRKRESLILGIVCLFVFGLAIRATMTGMG